MVLDAPADSGLSPARGMVGYAAGDTSRPGGHFPIPPCPSSAWRQGSDIPNSA